MGFGDFIDGGSPYDEEGSVDAFSSPLVMDIHGNAIAQKSEYINHSLNPRLPVSSLDQFIMKPKSNQSSILNNTNDTRNISNNMKPGREEFVTIPMNTVNSIGSILIITLLLIIVLGVISMIGSAINIFVECTVRRILEQMKTTPQTSTTSVVPQIV